MFQHIIIICIGVLATVYSSPISEREASNLISLLKQSGTGESNKQTRDIPERLGVELLELVKKEFEMYKTRFNKIYKSVQDEEDRLSVFFESMRVVRTHNEKFEKGEKAYKMEMNEMSDWTQEEYNNLNGFKPSYVNGSAYIPLHLNSNINFKLPSEIDWREKGAVTPVKNQSSCGSCYTFASTGALEGQMWRKTGKLISLSEQQIVDCDRLDHSCHGGDMVDTFTYIKAAGGLMSEEAYPYISGYTKAPNDKCSFRKSEVKAIDTGFVVVEQDEAQIQEVVATIGPVAISIHADEDLHHYSSGIYYDSTCKDKEVNHAVLLVGYGTEKETGMPYWIIKNSWGKNWGENGYIRMPRNVNACNIISHVVFPLV